MIPEPLWQNGAIEPRILVAADDEICRVTLYPMVAGSQKPIRHWEDSMRELRLVVGNKVVGSSKPGSPERRRNLRIAAPFPALVRGISENGTKTQFHTEIDNLSTAGVFLRTNRNLREWKRLMVVMRLSLDTDQKTPAPVVVARGEILRAEVFDNDCTGYAVALKAGRFV
jgi:hypothetical protein